MKLIMTQGIRYVVFFLSVIFSSCTPRLVKTIIHQPVDATNYQSLNGVYLKIPSDTLAKTESVFEHFAKDSLPQKDLSIKISCADSKRVTVEYLAGRSVFKTLLLRGRYKKGFFEVKRKLSFTFPAAVLFWGIRRELVYIGLDKNNDLLVINDSGGTAMVLVIPIGGSGGEYNEIFKRQ